MMFMEIHLYKRYLVMFSKWSDKNLPLQFLFGFGAIVCTTQKNTELYSIIGPTMVVTK